MAHQLDRSEQKHLIESQVRSSLQDHSKWNVVSVEWFNRLKKYVGLNDPLYDTRSSEEIESYHPGPIDNTDIVGDNEGELKRNLFEGVDYVLLPSEAYQELEGIYGGGPSIVRKVVSIESAHSRQLQVELYPIRVRVFLDSEISGVSDLSTLSPSKTLMLSRRMDIKDALSDIRKSLKLDGTACRYWARVGNDGMPDSGTNGRKMTADLTDTVDGWRFLRSVSGIQLSEINFTTIDIMVELKAKNDSGEWYWPKDEALNKWKYHLRRGDLIDAKDEVDVWYEAVVQRVGDDGINVHFKGWNRKFDRDIPRSEFGSFIAPLYTMTENWRDALEEKDRVDFAPYVDLNAGSKWQPAHVVALNRTTGQLKLKYRDDCNVVRSSGDWLNLYGESITRAGTHVKNSCADFSDTPLSYQVGSNNNSAYSSYNNYNATSTYGTSKYNSWGTRSSNHIGTPVEKGVVGLMNLGNTCFMNSMLQCLSNTKRLTDVFTSDRYASQLNKTNALGHGGKVASSYAKLVKDMWCGQYTVVAPEDFKRTIGEFQPQFSGYQQQDSQEFMLFLLDGLHEDMNRIMKKPYVEKIDSGGRDDELIARESWRRFLLRNDSELVDCCFGQLRSHVTCASCGYQSVTFDEYSSLSLPLPIKNTVEVVVVVYPLPYGSTPIRLVFEMDVTHTVADAKKIIATKLSVTPDVKRRRQHSNSLSTESGEFVMVDHNRSMGCGGSTEDEGTGSCSSSGVHVDTADSTDDEIEVAEEGSGDAVMVSTPKQTRKSPPADSQTAGGFLHICTAGKSGSKINKTFDDRTSAKELAKTTYDMLVAYELEHPAPCSAPTTTSYYGSSRLAPDVQYGYCDVMMGAIQKNRSTSSYLSFDLIGPSHRISYHKGHTTVRDIYKILWDVMKEYVHEDSTYYDYNPERGQSGAPYEVHITNSYGYTSKGKFTGEMEKNFVFSQYEALMCVWKEDAREPDHFDENAVSRLHLGDGELESHSQSSNIVREGGEETRPMARKKSTINITDCLNKFVEREQMPAEETWYCPKCKQHLAPVKKFDLWTTPDILIIHLKRFQYVSGTYFVQRDKLGQLVDFPITGLDLRDYVKSSTRCNDDAPPVYDLYGVSEHIGGMGGGHYTAVAQNPINQKWYRFNDSSVEEICAEDAVSPKAYVLFYKRRHGSARWAGMVPLEEELKI
mmetsp:Transcript_22307/g.32479  ORF Transcript_22307/g.32479 Transcript_22307/m.32479 type:complete len:1180 (+) Transcript_22307:45-3584(+)